MPTLSEFTAKVQFATAARHPALIRRACVARGMASNTEWLQHVVAEALSRDLDIPLDELLAELPALHGSSNFGHDENRRRISAAAKK
jgi:hypothetical protein